MSKVYQCDRCKTIFEPRKLKNGEPYITRKAANNGRVINSDIDLCSNCYKQLIDWFENCKDFTHTEKAPTGEWIKNETRPDECQCSNCGNYDLSYFPFCHWCGTDMRVKDELEEAKNVNTSACNPQ